MRSSRRPGTGSMWSNTPNFNAMASPRVRSRCRTLYQIGSRLDAATSRALSSDARERRPSAAARDRARVFEDARRETASMVCVTCGGQVEAGARFCPRCGRAMAPGAAGAPPAAGSGGNFFDDLQDQLHRFAGTNRLEGFSLTTMFSEVFKRRTVDEVDDYFLVGTRRTTPPIESVESGWPRPWFFARVLLFVLVVYVG